MCDNSNSLRAIYADKQVGEYFEFGRYPQGENGEIRSVIWRVLRRDDDGLFVISEKALDSKLYDEVTWAGCALRKWLNSEFLSKAFNEQEQSLIKISEITNNAGPDTEDRVFLLSDEEVKIYFPNDDCMCEATDYAVENGAVVSDGNYRVYEYDSLDYSVSYDCARKGNVDWCLRSLEFYYYKTAWNVCHYDDFYKDYEGDGYLSIRPALNIAINPFCEIYANKQVGEYFELGRYPQGEDGEVEPITWRVLRRDSDSLLIISEKVLDCKHCTWADCTLRKWLNNEFLSKAFNEQEQSLIKTSKIGNDVGTDTEDRAFLLSENEASSLFADDNDRMCKPTDYAVGNGTYVTEGNAFWWLRSRGNRNNHAGVVTGDSINSLSVISIKISVRPALRLAI